MEIKFNQVAIITGGSMGIGAGCARVFVEAGARVVICARGRKKGEDLAAELTAKGPGSCHFEPCDVSKQNEIKNLIDKTVSMYGQIDCLINNAGMHPDHASIDGFSIEDFEALLRLNLVSYFAACKFALPHLRKTRGSIINMGSLVGSMGQEWACTYVATKGGISALTKALAIDEARHGVRVNCVMPGNIRTPASLSRSADLKAHVASWQWTGREGIPEEVGQACLFLAGDNAGSITGIELLISGGAELGYGVKQPDPFVIQLEKKVKPTHEND